MGYASASLQNRAEHSVRVRNVGPPERSRGIPWKSALRFHEGILRLRSGGPRNSCASLRRSACVICPYEASSPATCLAHPHALLIGSTNAAANRRRGAAVAAHNLQRPAYASGAFDIRRTFLGDRGEGIESGWVRGDQSRRQI